MSATPYLARAGAIALESVFVSLLAFGVDDFDPDRDRKLVTGLEVSGREVVLCMDGDWWFLQMVSPERVERTLGGRSVRGAVRVARVSPDGSCFTFDADGQVSS